MKKLLFLLLIIPSALLAQQPTTIPGPLIIRYKIASANDTFKVAFVGDTAKVYTTQDVFVFNKIVKVNKDTLSTLKQLRDYVASHNSTYSSNILYYNSTLNAYTPYTSVSDTSLAFYRGNDNGETSYNATGFLKLNGSFVAGSSNTSNNQVGITGVSYGSTGVRGYSNSYMGVYGGSYYGIGTYGNSINNTGVYGNSTLGTGTYGSSDNGAGIYGYSNSGYGIVGNSMTGVSAYFANGYHNSSDILRLAMVNGSRVKFRIDTSGNAYKQSNTGDALDTLATKAYARSVIGTTDTVNTTRNGIMTKYDYILLLRNTPSTGNTFSGQFDLSSHYVTTYVSDTTNTSVTPSVSSNRIKGATCRYVIRAGASATLGTGNLGTKRKYSDDFTAGKKNELVLIEEEEGLYYSITILN